MESLYTSAIDRNNKVIKKMTAQNCQVNAISVDGRKTQKEIVGINKPKLYTMEEAIEAAGFGIFQIKLIALTGFAYVTFNEPNCLTVIQ